MAIVEGYANGAIDKHAPLKSKRVGNKKSPWITNQLRHERHKRDFLKKKAAMDGTPLTWDEHKRARNHTNNEIKKVKRKYFTENLKSNISNPQKTWKLINELNSRHPNKVKNIPEIKVREQTITEPSEIAEELNLHFSSIGGRLAFEIPSSNVEPEFYLEPTKSIFSLKAPTVDVVRKLLSKLNESKAAGLDNIPNKLLKMAGDIVAPSLTQIFTKSISTGVFPTEWKLARVSPIFKKGKRDDPNNYRPISIIPTVAKIFEKIVYDQLCEYLNDNNLLTHCQSGFRSLHSTLTALIEATNCWSVNIDNGLVNGVIFIDLKKAFDTIDHSVLIRKLHKYGVDRSSLKWFESYLCDRSQKCSINGHLSNIAPVSCGVPQGSNLGPLLFLVYINDLPNCLSLASPRMFADGTNTTFAASSMADLENVINSELRNLNCWLVTNKLSLNIAKTEFMVIGSNQRVHALSNNQINIEIDGKSIKRVKEAKSLGLLIDEHLSWTKHIDEKSKTISSAIGALKRIRPFISESSALQIYQALILPHFDYCSSVWDELNVTLSDKLQKLQNRAARVITRSSYDTSTSFLLKRLHWDDLSTRRKKLKATLMFKTIKGLSPLYLQNLFSIRSTSYNLRDSEIKLDLPKPRTNYRKRSFGYSGALLWNSLPVNLRKTDSLGRFKREIDRLYNNCQSGSHTAIL